MLNVIRLDFVCAKNELRPRFAIIYILLAAMGYFSMGIYGIAFAFFPTQSMLAVSPFSAGDNGLDKLYSILPVSRKQIVYGRYLYVAILSAALLLIFLLLSLGLGLILGESINLSDFLGILIGVLFISGLFSSTSTAMMFKYGFKKSRILATLLPMLIPMIALAFVDLQGIEIDVAEFASTIAAYTSIWQYLVLMLIWLAIIATSVFASVKF